MLQRVPVYASPTLSLISLPAFVHATLPLLPPPVLLCSPVRAASSILLRVVASAILLLHVCYPSPSTQRVVVHVPTHCAVVVLLTRRASVSAIPARSWLTTLVWTHALVCPTRPSVPCSTCRFASTSGTALLLLVPLWMIVGPVVTMVVVALADPADPFSRYLIRTRPACAFDHLAHLVAPSVSVQRAPSRC